MPGYIVSSPSSHLHQAGAMHNRFVHKVHVPSMLLEGFRGFTVTGFKFPMHTSVSQVRVILLALFEPGRAACKVPRSVVVAVSPA